MPPLEFLFQEMEDGIVAISRVAHRFLNPYSPHVFESLRYSLEEIRTASRGDVYRWEIAKDSPIRTVTSEGAYNPDAKGGPRVSAAITSCWEISPLGARNVKSWPNRRFALAGQATTRVTIFEETDDGRDEIAMWRMDIGDDNSPGCHFHVQVLGESDFPPFPHSLPVPRLPALMFTPMSAIEYVLGELFQDEWRMHSLAEDADMARWRTLQRRWLGNSLSWQRSCLDSLTGSPWVALKRAKPPANLFLGDWP